MYLAYQQPCWYNQQYYLTVRTVAQEWDDWCKFILAVRVTVQVEGWRGSPSIRLPPSQIQSGPHSFFSRQCDTNTGVFLTFNKKLRWLYAAGIHYLMIPCGLIGPCNRLELKAIRTLDIPGSAAGSAVYAYLLIRWVGKIDRKTSFLTQLDVFFRLGRSFQGHTDLEACEIFPWSKPGRLLKPGHCQMVGQLYALLLQISGYILMIFYNHSSSCCHKENK